MNILPILLLTAFSGAIELSVAPDQPLPYVYVDDPLVLELKSTEDVQAQVHLEISQEGGREPFTLDLAQVSLRAHGSRWIPVKDAPAARGRYQLSAKITTGGETVECTGEFYRVDRPADEGLRSAYAHGGEQDPRTLVALSSVGVKTIRLDAAAQDIDARLKEAARQKFRAVIYLDPSQIPEPAALVERLSREHCADISRWEINPHADPGTLQLMAETVRNTGCNASLAVVVQDAKTLGELLLYKSGHRVREAVLLSDALAPEEIEALRQLTEQAGYEAWRLDVLGKGIPAGAADPGLALVHQILRNLAAGVSQTGFASDLIYAKALEPAAAYLNGMSHRVTATQFVGNLDLGADVTALVFREDGAWLVALWAATARDIKLPLAQTDRVVITDAFNNALDVPRNAKEEATLHAGPAPLYITGRQGNILGIAATNAARRYAREFQQRFQGSLDGDLLGVIAAVEQDPASSNNRVNYFSILRALPELERRWHAGELPRNVAAPAIAQLARLARSLATVEEQRAEPFLELLQDTLAHGEELQSLYLTGSTGSSEANERGDWLVDEVRRLLDEAEELASGNRPVEASAVAALAEWRARGLEFAAHAKPASEDAEPVVAAAPPMAIPAAETPAAAIPEAVPAAPPPAPEPTPPPVPQEITHKVAKNESLSVIADHYNVKLDDLLAWNKLSKRSRLKIGQELVIKTADASATPPVAPPAPEAAPPVVEPAPEPTPEPPPTEPKAAAGEQKKLTHKVARNENPSIIAEEYHVSLGDFLKWNNFTKDVKFQIGQEVIVYLPKADAAPGDTPPAAETPAPETPPDEGEKAKAPSGKTQKIIHTVKKGDTPASIAKQYGVDLEAFRKLNGLRRDARLATGKKYTVIVPAEQAKESQNHDAADAANTPAPDNGAGSAPDGTTKIVHKVGRGDNPYTISKKYDVDLDDFLKWNNLNKKSMLQIGQEMIVFVKKGRNST